MAKVIRNNFTMGLSGKYRNLVFRQMKDGRTILASAPDFSNRKLSKEQRSHHSRFKEAAAYARVAARTNPAYKELATGTSKNAYNLALSDWFHAPVTHEVSRKDNYIRVAASNNVQVTKVLVTISDGDGKTLEQGQATMRYDTLWEYITLAPAEAELTVEAFDLAGNCTKLNQART